MDQTPVGAGATPLRMSDLGFHPVGLYDLRRHLGKPSASIFQTYRSRFEAADFAWFAAGLASEPANIKSDEFYPQLHELRSNTAYPGGTEIRKDLRKRLCGLTFDFVRSSIPLTYVLSYHRF